MFAIIARELGRIALRYDRADRALALALSITAVADWTLTQHSAPANTAPVGRAKSPADEYG